MFESAAEGAVAAAAEGYGGGSTEGYGGDWAASVEALAGMTVGSSPSSPNFQAAGIIGTQSTGKSQWDNAVAYALQGGKLGLVNPVLGLGAAIVAGVTGWFAGEKQPDYSADTIVTGQLNLESPAYENQTAEYGGSRTGTANPNLAALSNLRNAEIGPTTSTVSPTTSTLSPTSFSTEPIMPELIVRPTPWAPMNPSVDAIDEANRLAREKSQTYAEQRAMEETNRISLLGARDVALTGGLLGRYPRERTAQEKFIGEPLRPGTARSF